MPPIFPPTHPLRMASVLPRLIHIARVQTGFHAVELPPRAVLDATAGCPDRVDLALIILDAAPQSRGGVECLILPAGSKAEAAIITSTELIAAMGSDE